jgi:hypothetical protein
MSLSLVSAIGSSSSEGGDEEDSMIILHCTLSSRIPALFTRFTPEEFGLNFTMEMMGNGMQPSLLLLF